MAAQGNEDEERFRLWAFERAAGGNRVSTASAAASSAFVWACMALAGVTDPVLHALLGWMFVCYGAGYVTLRRNDRARGTIFAVVTYTSGGALALYACATLSSAAGSGIVAAIGVFMLFFMQGAHRDRPWVATAPAIVLAIGVEVVLIRAWARGELTTLALTLESALVAASLAIGAMLLRTNGDYARQAFHHEQLIEEQRATIAKQQALLEKELSHQVAERSRELGQVLAKSDVTLDARGLKEGERFAERYRIVRALGAGGMGAVYEVERVTDGSQLALKAVVGEVSAASAARFAREAEIGARVRHPSLVSIVDVGVASGVPFLVMEMVKGGSLEAQRSRFGEVAWALPILRQIAAGLAALHDAGVVHRDLKPANVLLDDGAAKISDFGISRFGSIEDSSVDVHGSTMAATPKKSAELTGTGVVMGTPLYMAPEAAKSARQLDASADVFAFGIIAYEMLTGRSPFAVPAFVLAMADQPMASPPPIEDARVPAAVRELVGSALAGRPNDRPRVRTVLTALA